MIQSAPAAQPATKTRILDAAEKLFGEKGFDGTSLRDITAEAQVNLAAVNYHFQSKESLIDAVIGRRIQPVNQLRLEMLDAAGSNPTVEQVVEAFLVPIFSLSVRPAVPLIGRVLSNPTQFVERVYKRHLPGVAERFAKAMKIALPDLPDEERFWRLQFMAGSMSHVLALSEVFPLMMGKPDQPVDKQALVKRMTTFLSAGWRAPVESGDASREDISR